MNWVDSAVTSHFLPEWRVNPDLHVAWENQDRLQYLDADFLHTSINDDNSEQKKDFTPTLHNKLVVKTVTKIESLLNYKLRYPGSACHQV